MLQETVADTAGEGAQAADPPESKGDETARNKDRYQVAGWCTRISPVAVAVVLLPEEVCRFFLLSP